jgi:hypothetical protein
MVKAELELKPDKSRDLLNEVRSHARCTSVHPEMTAETLPIFRQILYFALLVVATRLALHPTGLFGF